MKIKILGHEYAVEQDPLMARDERNGGGKCNLNALRIVIDPTLPTSRRRENLMHEIFEGLNYHLQLELPHDKMSALCEGLFSVMMDNKSVFTGFMVSRGGDVDA